MKYFWNNLYKIIDQSELLFKTIQENKIPVILERRYDEDLIKLISGLIHYFYELELNNCKIYFVFGSYKTNILLTDEEKNVLKNKCFDKPHLGRTTQDTINFIKNSNNIQFLKKNQHKDICNILTLNDLVSFFLIPQLDMNGYFYYNYILCVKNDFNIDELINLELKLSNIESIIPYSILPQFLIVRYLKNLFYQYNYIFKNTDINVDINIDLYFKQNNLNFSNGFYYCNLSLCIHVFYDATILYNLRAWSGLDNSLINDVNYIKWWIQKSDDDGKTSEFYLTNKRLGEIDINLIDYGFDLHEFFCYYNYELVLRHIFIEDYKEIKYCRIY